MLTGVDRGTFPHGTSAASQSWKVTAAGDGKQSGPPVSLRPLFFLPGCAVDPVQALVELLRRRDLAGKDPLGSQDNPHHYAISFIEIGGTGSELPVACLVATAVANAVDETVLGSTTPAPPTARMPASGQTGAFKRGSPRATLPTN
jgi:hypothetical protein